MAFGIAGTVLRHGFDEGVRVTPAYSDDDPLTRERVVDLKGEIKRRMDGLLGPPDADGEDLFLTEGQSVSLKRAIEWVHGSSRVGAVYEGDARLAAVVAGGVLLGSLTDRLAQDAHTAGTNLIQDTWRQATRGYVRPLLPTTHLDHTFTPAPGGGSGDFSVNVRTQGELVVV